MSVNDNSNFDGDDDEYVQPGDVVGQLRKALKAQQKANKEQAEALEAARTELSGLKSQVNQTSLQKILESKGAKPGLSKFVPTDLEVTEEAVSAWLAENGEFFGYDPNASTQNTPEGNQSQQAQQQSGLDPQLEAILASMNKVQKQEANAAEGPVLGEDKTLDFLARVDANAKSYEDVEKALRQAGFFN